MNIKRLSAIVLLFVCAVALAATYSDAFTSGTSANTGCGSSWTQYQDASTSTTGGQATGGVCRATASFTFRQFQWNGGAVGNDQFSQVTLAAGTVDYNEGVTARMSADTFYACRRLSDTLLRLVRFNAGVATTLDTQTATLTTPVVLRIEISGSNVTCKVGGSTVIGPYADGTPIASGQPGFYTANNADFDDWSGGDLSAGSVVVNPISGRGGAAAQPVVH